MIACSRRRPALLLALPSGPLAPVMEDEAVAQGPFEKSVKIFSSERTLVSPGRSAQPPTLGRPRTDAKSISGEDGKMELGFLSYETFGEYVDWRFANPSDDVMTELITTEFEDENGLTRTLTRDEVMTYVTVLASAGNETTGRLIGWMGSTSPGTRDSGRSSASVRLSPASRAASPWRSCCGAGRPGRSTGTTPSSS
jgi:hypothetical protein